MLIKKPRSLLQLGGTYPKQIEQDGRPGEIVYCARAQVGYVCIQIEQRERNLNLSDKL